MADAIASVGDHLEVLEYIAFDEFGPLKGKSRFSQQISLLFGGCRGVKIIVDPATGDLHETEQGIEIFGFLKTAKEFDNKCQGPVKASADYWNLFELPLHFLTWSGIRSFSRCCWSS